MKYSPTATIASLSFSLRGEADLHAWRSSEHSDVVGVNLPARLNFLVAGRGFTTIAAGTKDKTGSSVSCAISHQSALR
jgi:hypothetical protein